MSRIGPLLLFHHQCICGTRALDRSNACVASPPPPLIRRLDVEVRLPGSAAWITKADIPALGGVAQQQTLEVNFRCPAGQECLANNATSFVSSSCPAGTWSDPAPSFPLVGVPCENNDCIGAAYYCPAGSVSPISVDRGYYSTPETAPIKARTGQSKCDEAENEFCGGGVKSTLPPGYYQNTTDPENEVRSICPLGFQCTNGNKAECSRKSYCPVGSDADLLCTAGFYCTTPSSRELCDKGYFCPAGTVAPGSCPAGQSGVNAEGFSSCVDCAPGSFRNTNSTSSPLCSLCEGWLHSQAFGSTECVGCPDGYLAEKSEGAAFCRACPAGRAQESVSACAPCSLGSISGVASTTCEVCGEGSYANAEGTKCVSCEAGSVPNVVGDGCDECTPGTSAAFGAAVCGPCEDGTASRLNKSAVCEYCVAGERSNEFHTQCEKCPSNAYSLGGVSKCTECGDLGLSEPGSSSCSPCKPGYAKNSEGTACVACTAGHARAFDDDSCSPCGDGYVAVEEGSAYCELCGIGNYSSADHTECLVCPRNTFSLGGVASCTECTAGSSKRGSSYCEDCTAGTFLNRGKVPPTCDECAAGSVSPAGASACTQCEAGTWQKGIECVACSAGRHGNATGLHSFNCSGTCPPGTHSYRYATKCKSRDAN